MYVTSRDGVTQVMSHGKPTPEMLAVNRLNDTFSASAAIAGRDTLEGHAVCAAGRREVGDPSAETRL